MRAGNGGGKRLIARRKRSPCGGIRRCKIQTRRKFHDNLARSRVEVPLSRVGKCRTAHYCMRAVAARQRHDGAGQITRARSHILHRIIREEKTMRHLSRLLAFIFCAIAALASTSAPSSAQTSSAPAWPTRAVRFIVPLGPGSGVDITARLFADRLSQKWGQPVVVENKPGGDSFMAINAVLTAHDDHMLLFIPASSFTAHAYLHDKLPYDPKDLVPIARVTNTLIAVAVNSKLPVKTLADLVKMARDEP